MMASARASTTRPSGVGVMPRAVRWNSGAPNMSSSSARALVTAGWLVDNCCATRVSDPSCRTCSSNCRWRIFRREVSRRTISAASTEGEPVIGTERSNIT
ncbi:Uncharacterised protein [Bordetella pertussis]|nr:Uncharacterised protein [Bordetella pertussis]CFP16064.1 Uncharacterised protein [Bordetella pertussis]CFU01753.1 Uncharacterised protein [Bordetella pertussis]CPJ03502.1 Uncharacterised protein [Bordetella pertussis]CPO75498.1 Uncharacterised protein [Bordetella pertussis]